MWFQMWTPHGFQVDTTGFPHGHHVVSTWTPCGVQETTWKPAQKQLCMEPTGFLVTQFTRMTSLKHITFYFFF